jgi:AcrR family transcriptional regulator
LSGVLGGRSSFARNPAISARRAAIASPCRSIASACAKATPINSSRSSESNVVARFILTVNQSTIPESIPPNAINDRGEQLPRRTLYNQFTSKEEIFREMLLRVSGHLEEAFPPGIETQGDVEEVLRLVAGMILDLHGHPEYLGFLRMVVADSRQFPWIAEEFAAVMDPQTERLARYVAHLTAMGVLECHCPTLAAHQFMGILNEFSLWPWMMGRERLAVPPPKRSLKRQSGCSCGTIGVSNRARLNVTTQHDPRKFAAPRDVNVALRPGSKPARPAGAAALEPKETAAAIVAIVVIHERRIKCAPPMTGRETIWSL